MHFPAHGSDGVWVHVEESCCSKSVAAHLPGCAGAEAPLPPLPVWEKPCSWAQRGWDAELVPFTTQRRRLLPA